MRKILIILCFLGAQGAFAQSQLRPMNFNEVNMLRVLSSVTNTQAYQDFNRFTFSISDGTVEELADGNFVYQIYGMAGSGCLVCGQTLLTITSQDTPVPLGPGTYKTYRAVYDDSKVDHKPPCP